MRATRFRVTGLWKVAALLIAQIPLCAVAAGTDEAVAALTAFKEGCKRAEALWPAQLCGPIVLVDPGTRAAVTNRPDPAKQFASREGMFVGEWPANLDVANTAVDWGGTRWAVVALGAEAHSATADDRAAAARRAAMYGLDAIRDEEVKRAERLSAERQRYRELLIDGPVLTLELPDRRLMYNPNTVLSLGDGGNVYPKSILIGPWGRLTLREGAALAPPNRDRARVAAPGDIEQDEQGTVTGPGWTLTLESGWRLVPDTRSGDFRVERNGGSP